MSLAIEISDKLSAQNVALIKDWNKNKNPFIDPKFISALERSDCIGAHAGWVPQHLLFKKGGILVAYMPLFVKVNSSGEFVFDWDWARAYQEHGMDYYPKLVTSIPFIPSMGPRVLHSASCSLDEVLALWSNVLPTILSENKLSSWHCLFPNDATIESLKLQPAYIVRNDCQYHWLNKNYREFNDFTATFKSRKRKQLKKERNLLIQAGYSFRRLLGDDITELALEEFYEFYLATYARYGHQEHLNLEFFKQLLKAFPDQILLIQAVKDEECLAAAFCMFDQETLFGRYWGSKVEQSGLHFETCYYQGIEFCIEQGLKRFDPGTQGKHKIVRGFEPTLTTSIHCIGDLAFRDAIRSFCEKESVWVKDHMAQAQKQLPFSTSDNESS